MFRITIITKLLFFLFTLTHAQVYNVYDGNINTDTYWHAPIIYIHTDINVKDNATLTIEEGSEVIFKDKYELKVTGKLDAIGSSGKKIIFKPENTSTGWEGLLLQPKKNNSDTVKLIHCIFEYGKPIKGDRGGVLNIEKDANVIIQNTVFHNNTATKNGGAINAKESFLKITNTSFEENDSPEDGGALYIDKGITIIENTKFFDNHAERDGGATFFKDAVVLKINNSTFQNNKTNKKGGALFSKKADEASISGCLITNNEAKEGGGLFLEDNADVDIINATITHNKASENNTDGIKSISSELYIINSIIWENPYSGINVNDVSHSIMWQMSDDANKIYNVDPEFINPSSIAGNVNDAQQSDWAVEFSSIAHNGGSPDISGLSLPESDISGKKRLSGDTIDMGAYEKDEKQTFQLEAVTDTILCFNEPLMLVSPSKGSEPKWRKDGNIIPVYNDTLYIPSVSEADEGIYTYILKETGVTITSKPMSVVVNPLPSVTLNDRTICEEIEAIIDPGLDPGFTYTWSTGETTPDITVSEQREYWLSVTNEHGCSANDTFYLTTQPSPVVNLPADETICSNIEDITISSNAANYATITWETTAAGNMTTTNAEKDINYTFTQAELQNNTSVTFYVTANNDYCQPAKDTTTVHLETAPSISISDEVICQGESQTFAVQQNAGYVYEWSSGATTHQVALSQEGEYSVAVTTPAFCVATDTFVLTVEEKPSVTLVEDFTLCTNENTIQLASNALDYSGVNWETTGQGSFETINGGKDITYTLSPDELENPRAVFFYVWAESQYCNSVKDSVEVQLVKTPAINLPDTFMCLGGEITVKAHAEPEYTYLWSTGSTQTEVILTEEGTYWVEVQNQHTCMFRDTFHLENTFPPSLSLQEDFVICSSDSTINVIPRTATNFTNITWSTSGNGLMDILNNGDALNYTFTPEELLSTNPLEIIATAISPACPETKDTLVIEKQAAPIISAPLTLDVCFTEQAIEMDVAITEGYDLSFQASEEGEINYVDSVLSYVPGIVETGLDAISLLIVSSQDPICPSVTHEITLNNAKPRAAFTVPDGCSDEEVRFLNTVYPAAGNKEFKWDFGDGNNSDELNPTHTYADSGKFSVSLIACNLNTCCDTTSHEVSITLKPEPSFEASYDCENISLNYTGTTYKDFRYRWRLSNGQVSETINPVFENNNSGSLALSVKHGNCSTVLEKSIDPFIVPEAQFTTDARNIGVNQDVSFINQSKNATVYEWTFEEGKKSNVPNPAFAFTSTGIKTVQLKAYSEDQCMDEYERVLDISAGLATPTAFSPNGDNINDSYRIFGGPFEAFELIIFNKWGIQMFYTRNPDEGWDGTFQGKTQPVGDYVYQVTATSVSGGRFAKSGSFALIR